MKRLLQAISLKVSEFWFLFILLVSLLLMSLKFENENLFTSIGIVAAIYTLFSTNYNNHEVQSEQHRPIFSLVKTSINKACFDVDAFYYPDTYNIPQVPSSNPDQEFSRIFQYIGTRLSNINDQNTWDVNYENINNKYYMALVLRIVNDAPLNYVKITTDTDEVNILRIDANSTVGIIIPPSDSLSIHYQTKTAEKNMVTFKISSPNKFNTREIDFLLTSSNFKVDYTTDNFTSTNIIKKRLS